MPLSCASPMARSADLGSPIMLHRGNEICRRRVPPPSYPHSVAGGGQPDCRVSCPSGADPHGILGKVGRACAAHAKRRDRATGPGGLRTTPDARKARAVPSSATLLRSRGARRAVWAISTRIGATGTCALSLGSPHLSACTRGSALGLNGGCLWALVAGAEQRECSCRLELRSTGTWIERWHSRLGCRV